MTCPFVHKTIEILLFLSRHDFFLAVLIRYMHGLLTGYRNRITASCEGLPSRSV